MAPTFIDCCGRRRHRLANNPETIPEQVPGQEPTSRAAVIPDPLRVIKVVHTIIWAILATCILAIPALGWAGLYRPILWMTGIVLVEAVILALNGWRCPLTDIASRYADDRRENFDIFLPVWLARYNTRIFGSIFVAGEAAVILRWYGWSG